MNFWDRPCALRKALFLLTTHTVVYTLEGLQREFVLVEFEVRGLGGVSCSDNHGRDESGV